jgi:branched-chain amino acid transport system ATP-binding protein
VLSVQGLRAGYGAFDVVRDVDVHVDEGEIVALLGPNGAGKTTTLRCIVGAIRPRAGSVRFEGRDLVAASMEAIARGGIRLVPEGRRILGGLSVADNLRLGATGRRDRSGVRDDTDGLLERFPVLAERYGQPAGLLSGGEQQMLAIARALMGRPRLLILDEPTLGLAPLVVDRVFDVLAELRDEGVTVLLVEQNAHRTIELADRAHLLAGGEVVLSGSRDDLRDRTDVVDAYLGV